MIPLTLLQVSTIFYLGIQLPKQQLCQHGPCGCFYYENVQHYAARWQCEDMAASQQRGCWRRSGGAAPALTSVGVMLLCPERTGSEGELALHGGLGFPILPQQFTPVQLRSFGKWGQFVFALFWGGEIKTTYIIRVKHCKGIYDCITSPPQQLSA